MELAIIHKKLRQYNYGYSSVVKEYIAILIKLLRLEQLSVIESVHMIVQREFGLRDSGEHL